MFWKSEDWKKYPTESDERVQLLEQIELNEPEGGDSVLVRWRELDFYKSKPRLVEIILNETSTAGKDNEPELDGAKGPTWGPRLYFIVRKDSSDQWKIHHLDGTSPPIHEVNHLEGGINLEKAEDYCDFFGSFVAAEGGPFAMLRKVEDLTWTRDTDVRSPIFALKQKVNEDLKDDHSQEFDSDESARQISTLGDIEKEFRTGLAGEITKKNLAENGGLSRPLELNKSPGNETTPNDQGQNGESGQEKKEESAPGLKAVIQYSAAVFIADFEINQTGMIKMLDDEPVEQRLYPLPIYTYDFTRNQKRGAYTPLRRKPYEIIGIERDIRRAKRPASPVYRPEDFKDDFEGGKHYGTSKGDKTESETHHWTDKDAAEEIGPGQAESVLNLRGSEFSRAIRIDEVVFFRALNLTDIVAAKSLIFRNCRFHGPVVMDNARIAGSLRFEDCWFYGYLPDSVPGDAQAGSGKPSDPTIAVQLIGIHVGGDLRFEGCTGYGSIAARGAVVGGRGIFRGLRLIPLHEGVADVWVDKNKSESNAKLKVSARFHGGEDAAGGVGLDLRYSSFGPGLDLSAWVPPPKDEVSQAPGHGEMRPTCVVGIIRVEACRIDGPVFASGVLAANLNEDVFDEKLRIWGSLSFANSRIGGNVQFWKPVDRPTGGYQHTQTMIEGDVSFAAAEVAGHIDARGIWIGGNFDGSLLKATGMLLLNNFDQSYPDNFSDSFRDCVPPPIKKSQASTESESVVKIPLFLKSEKRLIRFGRTHIGGSVNLTNAGIGGNISFSGALIAGTITCREGEYGSLSLTSNFGLVVPTSNYTWFPTHWSRRDYLKQESDEDRALDLAQRFKGSPETLHLEQNPAADEKTSAGGILLMRCQASRFILHDSVVHGPVDLTGFWLDETSLPKEAVQHSSECKYSDIIKDSHVSIDRKDRKGSVAPNSVAPIESNERTTTRLKIENTDIEGPLKLFDPDGYAGRAEALVDHKLRWHFFEMAFPEGESDTDGKNAGKNAKIARCEEALRRSIALPWLRMWCGGSAEIKNTKIDGEFNISGATFLDTLTVQDVELTNDLVAGIYPAQRPDPNPEVPVEEVPVEEKEPKWKVSYTSANRYVFEMLRCDGDVWVPGLSTHSLVGTDEERTRLDGQNLSIKGRVHFVERLWFAEEKGAEDQTPAKGVFGSLSFSNKPTPAKRRRQALAARIGGLANLTGGVFHELYIGGCNSVSLERARVSQIKVHATTDGDRGLSWLKKIDLRGTRFDRLTIVDEKEKESEDPKDLKTLLHPKRLKATKGYNTEPGAIVEKIMRAQGRRGDADWFYEVQQKFYREGLGWRWRELKEWIWLRLFGGLTGFGVGRARLFASVIALFAWCCLLVTGQSENWHEPTSVSLADKVFATIAITAPIIDLKLHKGGSGALKTSGNTQTVFPFELPATPHTVAKVHSFAGWILWPLFLLVLSGFIKRE